MTNFDALPQDHKDKIERAATALDAFMDKLDEIAAPDLYREVVSLRSEVERLTTALGAANADRDRMAQQMASLNQSFWEEHTERVTAETNLGIAQSEARGLREELRRLSMPNDGGIA